MRVEIVTDSRAATLLGSDDFIARWEALAARCPWTTPFQQRPFAATWYSSYQAKYEPVLVMARDASDELCGLLLLARHRRDGQLMHVGSYHAEYQTWLCNTGRSGEFVHAVMPALWNAFPGASLELKYLPDPAQTQWVEGSPLRSRIQMEKVPRPLMQFGDGSQVTASLRKKTNKTKLRALNQVGQVELVLINDAEQIAPFADEIIAIHDARHLAVRGSAPFENDPCKWPFHMALLKLPDLLHTTLLMAGTRLASVQMGLRGRDQMYLGVLAHDPWLSSHSPGKFHLYYLAQLAMRQGLRTLDLTPGGEGYKDRFATDWDEVGVIRFFPSRLAMLKSSACESAKRISRRVLGWCRLSPSQAKLAWIQLRHPSALPLAVNYIASVMKRVFGVHRSQIYRLDLESASVADRRSVMRKDLLAGLMAYRPSRFQKPRSHFVGEALDQIESGAHVFTQTRDGALLSAAFVKEQVDAKQWQDLLGNAPEVPAALITRICVLQPSRRRECCDEALHAVAADLIQQRSHKRVYIAVPDSDTHLRQSLTAAGFVPEQLCTHRVSFGRTRITREAASVLSDQRVAPSQARKELVSEGRV